VLVITPKAVINSITCTGGSTAAITGSGFGGYLDAANSGTYVTGDVTVREGKGKNKTTTTTTETAQINSWTDNEIAAQFSACPDDGTVVVSTVWDIIGSSGPPTDPEICDDGIDNDGDDLVDCDDVADCDGDPICGDGCTRNEKGLCGDGIDNDCDGLVDCDDRDCRKDC